MSILGITFMESHGLKTAAMVPVRLLSLLITAFQGLIIWPYLCTFWLSSFIAGKYATKYAKRLPDRYFKPILTFISLLFVAYLLVPR